MPACVSTPNLVLYSFPEFQLSAGNLLVSGYSGILGALAVIFNQPALCDLLCFNQRSEQIKIQYFCPVR